MSDSPESTIAKAIEILNRKQVAKNISTLLNEYSTSCGGIHIDKDAPNLNELMSTLELKRIDKSIKFSFDNKAVHLLAANMHTGSFPDGESYTLGDLFLLFNGECVLHSSLSQEFDAYGSNYSVSFHPSTLKRFKAANWIDDLAYLEKTIKEIKQREAQKEKESDNARTASNIDLGEYK